MCLILLQDTMASKLDLILISASGQSTNEICVVYHGGSDVLDLSVNSVFVRFSFFLSMTSWYDLFYRRITVFHLISPSINYKRHYFHKHKSQIVYSFLSILPLCLQFILGYSNFVDNIRTCLNFLTSEKVRGHGHRSSVQIDLMATYIFYSISQIHKSETLWNCPVL